MNPNTIQVLSKEITEYVPKSDFTLSKVAPLGKKLIANPDSKEMVKKILQRYKKGQELRHANLNDKLE